MAALTTALVTAAVVGSTIYKQKQQAKARKKAIKKQSEDIKLQQTMAREQTKLRNEEKDTGAEVKLGTDEVQRRKKRDSNDKGKGERTTTTGIGNSLKTSASKIGGLL